jgi:hypothetical protein
MYLKILNSVWIYKSEKNFQTWLKINSFAETFKLKCKIKLFFNMGEISLHLKTSK